jgi:phosphatidylglycerol:prolipoprotein diacylglycerol transferase
MFLLIPENAAPDARVLWPWKGGYWYHGGLAGGIAAYALYHAVRRNNIIDGLDLAAPFVALGEAITRIGCFLSGCCYGIPVSSFPGVVFPRNSHPWLQQLHAGLIREDAAGSLPVHPVQLYMALSMTVLFVVLRLVAGKQVVRGEITLLFFVSHCFIRFWTEFLRGDMTEALYGLSLTQWISIVVYLLALSALVLVYRRKQGANTVRAPAKEAISWQ